MKKIIFIMGPTASGKTALAVELVKRLPVEIISVDSTMVYRGLDIGSAKPQAEVLKEAPHHLINLRDPSEPYSAGDFRRDALVAINEITARGKIPLLVGGTMMYFNALRHGLADLPVADHAVRESLKEQARELGWGSLHAELERIDPIAAAKIHPNDSQRIQRALEVYLLTGKAISAWQQESTHALADYEILEYKIIPPSREELHKTIAQRFKQMLAAGFLEEVRGLYERGDLHADLPAIRSVGYKQAWGYLAGELSRQEMEEKAIIATRQLAKRQITWLRSW